MKSGKILSLKYIIFDFFKITGAIPALIFWRPKLICKNPEQKKHIKGGALIISNHISFFDPIYLLTAIWDRRLHFIALKVMFNNWFKNFIFTNCLCIKIDRENFNMNTFREITGHLKNDEVVVMFPEGHINFENSNINPFKSSMVLMALKSGKPIIPVYIKKRTNIWQRLYVYMGEPVSFNGDKSMTSYNFNDINKVVENLYRAENDLKDLAEKGADNDN